MHKFYTDFFLCHQNNLVNCSTWHPSFAFYFQKMLCGSLDTCVALPYCLTSEIWPLECSVQTA